MNFSLKAAVAITTMMIAGHAQANTILNFENGEFTGSPGRGRFVERGY